MLLTLKVLVWVPPCGTVPKSTVVVWSSASTPWVPVQLSEMLCGLSLSASDAIARVSEKSPNTVGAHVMSIVACVPTASGVVGTPLTLNTELGPSVAPVMCNSDEPELVSLSCAVLDLLLSVGVKLGNLSTVIPGASPMPVTLKLWDTTPLTLMSTTQDSLPRTLGVNATVTARPVGPWLMVNGPIGDTIEKSPQVPPVRSATVTFMVVASAVSVSSSVGDGVVPTTTLPNASGSSLGVIAACATPPTPIQTLSSNSPSQCLDIACPPVAAASLLGRDRHEPTTRGDRAGSAQRRRGGAATFGGGCGRPTLRTAGHLRRRSRCIDRR